MKLQIKSVKVNFLLKVKYFLFFAIFVSPMGAQCFTIDVAGVKMSLFRMAMIMCFALLFLKKNISVWDTSNHYSVEFMLAWFVYAMLSLVWAIDATSWMRCIFFIFIGISSLILFINVFQSIEDIKLALFSLLLGISVQCVIGWYEIMTGNYKYLFDARRIQVYSDGRIPVAMMGNTNDYATLMFVGFFVGLFFYFSSYVFFRKLVLLFLVVNCGILLFMTNSRANILGLILGVGFLVLFLEYKKSLLLFLFGCSLFLFTPILAFLNEKLLFNFNGVGNSDPVRIALIRTGLDIFVDSLGFGIGAGQSSPYISRFGSDYMIFKYTSLHNWWIEILTEFGLFIFIGYLIFYTKQFFDNYKTVKLFKHNQILDFRNISTMFCCILVGFTIACVSSSSNMYREWLWIFWSICIAYESVRKKLIQQIKS